ncbi:MAG TPA: hypothetical protein QKA14_01825 [Candidatus Megaira endosymbiont of Hartmannula sinica]|nr:hypothetical protein [Candidatus Megaera endosymbiont of Hartmannula sinica]
MIENSDVNNILHQELQKVNYLLMHKRKNTRFGNLEQVENNLIENSNLLIL